MSPSSLHRKSTDSLIVAVGFLTRVYSVPRRDNIMPSALCNPSSSWGVHRVLVVSSDHSSAFEVCIL